MGIVECIKCGEYVSDNYAVEVYSCQLGSDYVCKDCYNLKKGCIEVRTLISNEGAYMIEEVDSMEEAMEIVKTKEHADIFIDNIPKGRYYKGEKIS